MYEVSSKLQLAGRELSCDCRSLVTAACASASSCRRRCTSRSCISSREAEGGGAPGEGARAERESLPALALGVKEEGPC